MPKYNIIYYEDGEKITRATSNSLEEALVLKKECEKGWNVNHIIEEIKPRKKMKRNQKNILLSFTLLK